MQRYRVWILWFFIATAQAQWQVQPSGSDAELRGLSMVDAKTVWASGAHSTILRSRDGTSWQRLPFAHGDFDFRDIEAFDPHHAIVMSAGRGAASSLWRTRDGGAQWQNVFTNRDEKGFWDAIDFWDQQNGFIFGDPVSGRFQLWLTRDGGQTWQLSPAEGMPVALQDEGAFAASGSCAVAASGGRVAFVTGGAARARAFVSHDYGAHFTVADLPFIVTAPSQGAFSVAWWNAQTLIAVGGDYKQPNYRGINAAISRDGGKTWQAFSSLPEGFFSAIAIDNQQIVVSGLGGTARGYLNAALTLFDRMPLNAVAHQQGVIFAVGPNGRVVNVALP